jgi:SPX domain protein involved in polyphosphate accumulation
MLQARNERLPEDKLQLQRFELKYRVPAQLAPSIRDFVSSYLVLDEYSAGQPDNSYHNHSLYLDSPDLQIYWDVINSNKNRFKLRVRYYNDEPDTPVFFEVKRRMNDAILKQRGPVRRAAVPLLLAGHLPEQSHLLSDRPQYLAAVQQFCRLMHDVQAVPKVHVAYRREAWVSQADNSVRVTIDRDICTAPHSSPDISTAIQDYAMPFVPDVILELKFTGRFPNWFNELVQVFHVMQCGAAKYADGVAFLGEHRLNSTWLPHETGDRVEKALRRRERRERNATDAPEDAASS